MSNNKIKYKIIVPKELSLILPKIGNKTKQKSLLKIFNALVLKSKYKNKEGYFEVSSKYLKKINSQYDSIMSFLKEHKILAPLTRKYLLGEMYGPSDIFTPHVFKRAYSAKHGVCIRYKFLVDIEKGETMEIEFEDPKKDKRWYKVLSSSLSELGYTPNISRDRFGARVYHNITGDYKEELRNKGFVAIDASTSQPRLLYQLMKERNIVDKNYNSIFENDDDFYYYLVAHFNLKDRSEAKDLFMHWALGNGYTKGYEFYKIFPEASEFLKTLKSTNYKDSSRYLSWKESRIFIDDLLNNVPVSFCITIHDSLIVRKKDAHNVLKYCKDKYPELKFKIEEL